MRCGFGLPAVVDDEAGASGIIMTMMMMMMRWGLT